MTIDDALESLETKRQMKLLADIMRSEKRPHILPLRMHDQEKNYSPALKKMGGYSYSPEEEGKAEEERQERCERHERLRNDLIEIYKNNNLIEEGATPENVNEQLRIWNDYFVPYGCPPLPEFEPEPTVMPEFASLKNRRVNPKRSASSIMDTIFPPEQR